MEGMEEVLEKIKAWIGKKRREIRMILNLKPWSLLGLYGVPRNHFWNFLVMLHTYSSRRENLLGIKLLLSLT